MIENKYLVIPTDRIFIAGEFTQHPTEEEAKQYAVKRTHDTRESFSVYEIISLSTFEAKTVVLETSNSKQLIANNEQE